MLENPSIPHYSWDVRRDVYHSDNVTGAENQQERLITLGWVVGFVDGEGCFSIGFIRQPNRRGRRGYRTGYQVAHEFAVTQGAKSIVSLGLIEIAEIAQTMNRQKPRHEMIGILRGHTPDVLDIG
jgi:hypothetical protein